MRKSLCLKVMAFVGFILVSINAGKSNVKKQVQRKSDWIRVPWTHGGHYYHNTVTKEDRDTLPTNTDL